MVFGWHGTPDGLELFVFLACCSIAAIVCLFIGVYVVGLGIALATAGVWLLYKLSKRQDQAEEKQERRKSHESNDSQHV